MVGGTKDIFPLHAFELESFVDTNVPQFGFGDYVHQFPHWDIYVVMDVIKCLEEIKVSDV